VAPDPWAPRGPRVPDDQLRLSDADRTAVAEVLGRHFSAGRLDAAEHEERLGRAMTAKTRADLAGLLDDLPEDGPAPEERHGAQRRSSRGHDHRRLLRLGVGVLVVWLAVAVVGALVHLQVLLAVLLVAVLVGGRRCWPGRRWRRWRRWGGPLL
jgi:Flp pilus assembly protein TadB